MDNQAFELLEQTFRSDGAEAAFDLAKKQGKLERWRSDLRTATGVLAEPRLVQTLESPKWPRERKHQLLDAAFTGAKTESTVGHGNGGDEQTQILAHAAYRVWSDGVSNVSSAARGR